MAELGFRLSKDTPENFAEVATALQEIQRFLQQLIQFKNTAPVSSDIGTLIVFFDGTNVRLYVQGKIGQSNVRKYRLINNT